MNQYFVGSLLAFEKKGDCDQVAQADVIVEITTNEIGGEVEIAFDDRNERTYLKFQLPEFISAFLSLKQTEK